MPRKMKNITRDILEAQRAIFVYLFINQFIYLLLGGDLYNGVVTVKINEMMLMDIYVGNLFLHLLVGVDANDNLFILVVFNKWYNLQKEESIWKKPS